MMWIDRTDRAKMVACMEFIARQINDEEIFERWLAVGVADGDIDYGDLDADVDDYYLSDGNFKELMRLFLRLMWKAEQEKSGLYCGGVVS